MFVLGLYRGSQRTARLLNLVIVRRSRCSRALVELFAHASPGDEQLEVALKDSLFVLALFSRLFLLNACWQCLPRVFRGISPSLHGSLGVVRQLYLIRTEGIYKVD